MPWTTDSALFTLIQADEPIKASTIRAVQTNITAAFAGETGAPPLSPSVVGPATGQLLLAQIGAYRLKTEMNMISDINPYIPGDEYTGTFLGFPMGTYRHMGGGLSGFSSHSGNHYYFANLFLKVSDTE